MRFIVIYMGALFDHLMLFLEDGHMEGRNISEGWNTACWDMLFFHNI